MTCSDCAAPARRVSPVAVVYLLGLTIFTLTTSEFMVAGMTPALATALSVTVGEVGHLISIYALGMAVGGPVIMILLLRAGAANKPALLALLMLYVAGSVIAALAPTYPVLALARLTTGAASSACFGVALSIAAGLVGPDRRGWAASIVLGGLMVAPVLGLPMTTALADVYGWRASFWAIAGLSAACCIAVRVAVGRVAVGRVAVGRDTAQEEQPSLKREVGALATGRLWAAFLTSGLIIGATFAAFSYAVPILTMVAGVDAVWIPAILAAYGAANIGGNIVVGRYADRHTLMILALGLVVLLMALSVFRIGAHDPTVAILCFLAVGMAGVPMNPAMVTRVMRAASPGPLVNTVHTSVITLGIAVGTSLGGLAIDGGFGLTAPLPIGAGMALLGLLSLLPRRWR